jgi:hypothetical protein
MNPVRNLSSFYFKSYFDIIVTSTSMSSNTLVPSGLLTKMLTNFSSLTWSAYYHPLDFIFVLIFGRQHKLWSSRSWNAIMSLVTWLPLGSSILLSALFSNTLKLHSFINSEISFYAHREQKVKMYDRPNQDSWIYCRNCILNSGISNTFSGTTNKYNRTFNYLESSSRYLENQGYFIHKQRLTVGISGFLDFVHSPVF